MKTTHKVENERVEDPSHLFVCEGMWRRGEVILLLGLKQKKTADSKRRFFVFSIFNNNPTHLTLLWSYVGTRTNIRFEIMDLPQSNSPFWLCWAFYITRCRTQTHLNIQVPIIPLESTSQNPHFRTLNFFINLNPTLSILFQHIDNQLRYQLINTQTLENPPLKAWCEN